MTFVIQQFNKTLNLLSLPTCLGRLTKQNPLAGRLRSNLKQSRAGDAASVRILTVYGDYKEQRRHHRQSNGCVI